MTVPSHRCLPGETGSGRASAHPGESGAETSKHLPHVTSLLHADDTQVVFLVHPDEEGLVVVVPADESAALADPEQTK